MVFLIDAFILILVYAGASMVQENSEINAGVHVGSAFITSILSGIGMYLVGAPAFVGSQRWQETAWILLVGAVGAWLVASILVRWLYGASDTTANRMALIVAVGQVFALLCARAVFSSAGIFNTVGVTA